MAKTLGHACRWGATRDLTGDKRQGPLARGKKKKKNALWTALCK